MLGRAYNKDIRVISPEHHGASLGPQVLAIRYFGAREVPQQALRLGPSFLDDLKEAAMPRSSVKAKMRKLRWTGKRIAHRVQALGYATCIIAREPVDDSSGQEALVGSSQTSVIRDHRHSLQQGCSSPPFSKERLGRLGTTSNRRRKVPHP